MNNTENNEFESHFGPEDLVFNKQDGKIMSGGFLINNIFLNNDAPALKTNNGELDKQVGGYKLDKNVSSIFKDLAVPAGLLYLQEKTIPHYRPTNYGSNEIVEDTLYDKLLKLSEPDTNKKRRQTKKGRKASKHNKTKRNKNK